jgi:hypothetical protein
MHMSFVRWFLLILFGTIEQCFGESHLNHHTRLFLKFFNSISKHFCGIFFMMDSDIIYSFHCFGGHSGFQKQWGEKTTPED